MSLATRVTALAQRIAAEFKTVRQEIAARELYTSRTGIMSLQAGITIDNFVAYRAHGLVQISINLTGTFDQPAGGSILIGYLTESWRPATSAIGSCRYATTGHVNGTVVVSSSTGAVTLWKDEAGLRQNAVATIAFATA